MPPWSTGRSTNFGHADEFRSYRVGPTGVEFEVVRAVILRALADGQALFVAKVGGGPAQQLRDAGIIPVDAYPFGAIEASLLDWYGKRRLTQA